MKVNKALSLPELAKGYIYCRDNSERLIKDAIILNNYGSYLSSIGNCRIANEEIAKAIIIWSASTYNINDVEKWDWFYKAMTDHKEKLRVLEFHLHWEDYKDKNKFNEIITSLRNSREQCIYVGLNNCHFDYPGELFDDIQTTSNIELAYSKKIHSMVFISEYQLGKSSIEDIVAAFNIEI